MSVLESPGTAIAIDGPLPDPPLYGLVQVATIVPTDDPHWQGGARVYPFSPDVPSGFDPCSTGTGRVKDEASVIDLPEFGAFGIYQNLFCSAFAMDYDAFYDRLVRAFSAKESFRVEDEFVAGDLQPLNPHLADANVTVLAGTVGAPTPVGDEEGLALLEDAIGLTAQRGLIHATPSTVTDWDTLVYVEGNRLRTKIGNTVVAGGGYIGKVPEGAPALTSDQQWAWATGPVQIRRSELFTVPGDLAEALDRAVNDVSVYAERVYLVDWDTQLQAAVLVDRSL